MIDFTKKVRTKGGEVVKILATDGIAPYSVAGQRKTPTGWKNETWTLEGQYWITYSQDLNDLINVPETREVRGWMIAYNDGSSSFVIHEPTMPNSSRWAIQRVKLTLTEGEGL